MSIPSAASTDGALPRLFEADIKHEEYNMRFHSRDVKMNVAITAYGLPFIKATDVVSLSAGHEGVNAAGCHFRTIVNNQKELEHNGKQLHEHIGVCAYDLPMIYL